jgi:hypothetical protein
VARFRAVEPGLWDHPVLRRGGFVARDLYIYLFGHCADDDGRFRVDAYTLLDGCFSRDDPVTTQQVADAIAYLAENGLLLMYGNGDQYGFLTGWYEHQFRLDSVTPSRLPEPPCEINTWEQVERVRRMYSEQQGKQITRAQVAIALRWYCQTQKQGCSELEQASNKVVFAEQARSEQKQPRLVPKQPLEVEVEVEVEVTSTALLSEAAAPDAKPTPAAPKVRPGRTAQTPEQLLAKQEELLAQLPERARPLVDVYLDDAAQANSTRKITAGRVVTLLQELVDAMNADGFSESALVYGLRAANRAGVANANYMKKAARDYSPERDKGNGSQYQAQASEPVGHGRLTGLAWEVDTCLVDGWKEDALVDRIAMRDQITPETVRRAIQDAKDWREGKPREHSSF